MRAGVIAAVHLALLITIPQHFSTAAPMSRPSSNAVSQVEKRATNSNPDSDPDSDQAGRLIPGDVPIWTRDADDQFNSGSLKTAPAHALHLSAGDIYAPSIMVAGSGTSLYLKLGQNCTISSDQFDPRFCPIIDRQKITIRTYFDKSVGIRTLYFNIIVDDRFVDCQANMTVTFVHNVNRTQYNVSGYLYFDCQLNAGCDSTTQPPPTDVPTQCNCPMTGSSDQSIGTHCEEPTTKVASGSKLDHLALPGILLVAVSVLLSATLTVPL